MLKNLKFKYKILVFPVLFCVISLTTSIIVGFINQRNGRLMEQTEKQFMPSIEISSKIATKLAQTQRMLQDAVASADESKLENADTLASQIKEMCLSLKSISDNTDLADSIAKQFDN